MAYGNAAQGKDGNRGVQAGSVGTPEGPHRPDGWLADVTSLSAPRGQLLGQPSPNQNRASRQAIPGSAETTPREQYNFVSPGEPGLLGQDRDDYGPDRRATGDDAQRPQLPNPNFPGASGSTNAGPQGDPINWASVAPYEYPEFPMPGSSSASDPTAGTGQ